MKRLVKANLELIIALCIFQAALFFGVKLFYRAVDIEMNDREKTAEWNYQLIASILDNQPVKPVEKCVEKPVKP